MKRALMQVYAVRSDEAVSLYQDAFSAQLTSSYPNEDGTLFHAELDLGGQILAVAERRAPYGIEGEAAPGNVMQFGLEFGEGQEAALRHAYETLLPGAQVRFPLAPCEYSPLMADLTDRYGVHWCLFV